ncbi:MAG: hypothetical protein HYY60_01160 [Parcubacteria group bacterium]|nr:hypothetical protein [Parcubacteria group bacterium]MBI3074803.1 hypothetical protein [Parcubacteria group bacterium]
MPLILIFAIIAAVSTAGILGLFAYRLQWIKKIRVSFPETSEHFFVSLLQYGFGNEKIEKYASRCWDVSQDAVVRCAAYVKSHGLTLKMKDRVDRFLGKSAAIPDRETSSVFLKSIAEHKKKMQEEEEVESEKF